MNASRAISAFLFLITSLQAVADNGLNVEFFSPQGVVKKITQVTARFSQPMVAFGDPRQPPPFDIQCSEKGTGRWVDQKNWAFDFEKELPAGVRCDFQVRQGLKSVAGKEFGGERSFSFSTGGPNIQRSSPYEGSSSINEDQVFILNLDGEADESSVLSQVYFSVSGVQEKVGVRIVSGSERETIIKSTFGRRRKNISPVLLLAAKQRFPPDSKVSLVWGKGVKSKSGVETGEDQVLPFEVKKPFSAEFSCERENKDAACIPFSQMAIRFSGNIPRDQVSRILLTSGKSSWKGEPESDTSDWTSSVTFKGPFPESSEFHISVPPDLEDDSGRKLSNPEKFPLTVHTDVYPPLAKFSASFGVLELNGDPMLPLTVRNLEPDVRARLLGVGKDSGIIDKVKSYLSEIRGKRTRIESTSDIVEWMKRVEHAKRDVSVFSSGDESGETPPGKVTEFRIPKDLGPKSFEVVGIPLKEPGFYVVEVKSTKLAASLLNPLERKNSDYMFVPTAVLVTNLSVHFKWGRESSLVWVTALDTGKPVPNAAVKVRDCSGQILWQGSTDTIGTARVTGLPQKHDIPSCKGEGYDKLNYGLLVTAEQGQDMSFVHTSWDSGIETWRFQLPSESEPSPNIAHTIFDRTLFRAGETVHMKHIIRRHGTRGFSNVPDSDRPKFVAVMHDGTEQKYEFPLKWTPDGVAETTWHIPKAAKLGSYSVRLRERSGEDESAWSGWYSGSFRVEEYRVPLMKAVIQPPADPLVAVSKATVDLSVSYLAGGGAAKLPVKLRHQVQPRGVWSFDDFEDYVFANGLVKEGSVRQGEEQVEGDEGEDSESGSGKPSVRAQDLVLDNSGTARATVSKLPKQSTPYEVLTELQFSDPNGEVQTVSQTFPVFPASQLIGIKLDSWAGSKDDLKLYVSVAGLKGKGVAGAPVKVDVFERKTFSHRKRIVGGFYAYESTTETKKLGPLCEGKTDVRGIFFCQGKAPATGNLILQASSSDDSGNATGANREVWVPGENDWWFEVRDNDRMDVLPEKKRYEPGETAKFQIRVPFRQATALVSVEREGVMEVFVKELSGKEPVIEVPIRPNYAPNVFVSVLAVRGRVGDVQSTALVDLGRPAYKLGIAEINVGWRAHELKVKVSSDKSVYKVRGKAKVAIQVRTAAGAIPPAGGEVAIAAVDEGLLELMPNNSWNLLPAMMGRRGYAIETSSAQMQVIGKRHFGLKALPQGGGGGGEKGTRELFDTLLLWKGRVTLDAKGEASAEIPLNDSITSFRIVAVSTVGTGLFGTGSTSIRSTQELMLFSGVPPLVREGDKFRAQFTLRNTTTHPMDVSLSLKADKLGQALKPLSVSLAGGEAKDVGWDVVVPYQTESVKYEVEAKEKSGAHDRIRVTQKVVPSTAVRVYLATIAQLEKSMQLPVEIPKDAALGLGGIQVALKPSLLSGLSGVTRYMKEYPYSCLEQETSRAVALRDKKLWAKLMEKLPSYLDSDGLAMYWPAMGRGSETLTAYLVSIAHEAGWAIPGDLESKMRSGLTGFVQGTVRRYSTMPTADLSIRKIAAVEALSHQPGKFDTRLLGSITIEPNLWPTSAVIDWLNILKRESSIAGRDQRLAEAEQILHSRINLQGTTMNFSTNTTDFLWWLMVSEDENAVRSVSALMDLPRWKDDVSRLVRGALGRQHHGHWDLTTANAWGVLAMEKFSRLFEKTPVAGVSEASLSGKTEKLEWKHNKAGKSYLFPWPAKQAPVLVSHRGAGKPWVMFQSLAAIPLQAPLWSGYRIKKEILPVEQKVSGHWSRGDIARVHLEIEGQSDMTWVALTDPIPAGSQILGGGMGRDSALATQDEKHKGWVWPAFEERSFEAYRAYYDWVPRGKWVTEYTIRINNAGSFKQPTTRVEAMYSPEMFGEMPNKGWEIQ